MQKICKSMNISENKVLEVLKTILHPSAKKDIVSVGLVKGLTIETNKIQFTLNFASVNDPHKSALKNACEIKLQEEFGPSVEIGIDISSSIKPIVKKQARAILPEVKNIIAIASGKGGVGKSTVATNLAVAFGISGAKVGLIDADIYGPSIPKMLGAENEKPYTVNIDGRNMIVPVERYGIKILSIGFFIDPQDPTIWRGPMASNALTQLMSDGKWDELDYLFIDLPPGTSDIHLTLVQNVPVTGALIVSTPQDVALADAIKGINMFRSNSINVPVLGLVENMAWFTPEELPQNKYYIFGKGGCRKLAENMNIPFLGEIPIVQSIRESGDEGTPSVIKKDITSEAFKNIAEKLRIEIIKRNTLFDPTKKVEVTKK